MKKGSKNEKVRKITVTGGYTYYVTIPKAMLDELGWRKKQKVVVTKAAKKIVIQDWRAK